MMREQGYSPRGVIQESNLSDVFIELDRECFHSQFCSQSGMLNVLWVLYKDPAVKIENQSIAVVTTLVESK